MMMKPRLIVLPCQAKGTRHGYIASHDQRIDPQIKPNIKCHLAVSSPIQPFFSPVTLVANRVGCEEYDPQVGESRQIRYNCLSQYTQLLMCIKSLIFCYQIP
ncbi:hypothetical protein CEP54_007338 [Fusarium duplospermum]|uniref:Uncharacterized protein n=1 Tax=Fusarium duplospermum TaxID=1325734 RepID=A0A428Q1T3_9HYPO|nr:hypothetical protein CEP54_007338 [Fusarium duplospermum]